MSNRRDNIKINKKNNNQQSRQVYVSGDLAKVSTAHIAQ